MSGLAEILIKEGFSISGSDIHTSDIIKHLEDKGAKVYLSQTADNITDDIDLVVYTAAINFDTNEEYKEAIRRNIPVMKRATLLGQMMHNYQNAIAVSGTHGKTTTTSMFIFIFLLAGKHRSYDQRLGGNFFDAIKLGKYPCRTFPRHS